MRRLLLIAALAAACSNQVATISSGQFAAPVGLAATSAGDRDLLFIANSGKDGLIALQLCTQPLDDGGNVQPGDTCSPSENAQFIPGPIRVFPGTIETAPRTVRVAGARLTLPDGGVPDGGANGEALAVGADDTLHVIDARALVDAEHGGASRPITVDGGVALGGQGVDVVAANALDPATDLEVPSPSVRVFAVTVQPAQLLAMTATLDANGSAQKPTLDGSCTLGAVIPRRLAVTPGNPATVYIADGAGDGVVRVDTSTIAGGACTTTRISAGGRTTRSVAVSPPWYASLDQTKHKAGEIVAMVVDPPAVSKPGRPLDPGGVLFARTSDGAIFPVPPRQWTDTGFEGMQPLEVTGLAREVAFLRSRAADSACPILPCTAINFGASPGFFDLLAAVTSTDGSTTLVDVINRRFPDGTLPALSTNATLLTPASNGIAPSTPVSQNATNQVTMSPGDDPNGPILTVDPGSAVPGVTHTNIWRAIYHSPIVGLDRRAGTLSPNADGTLTFVSPPADLAVWTADPIIQLGAGDLVSFGNWSSADPNCQNLVTAENNSQYAFELPIRSISGNSMVLGAAPGKVDLSGSCATVTAVAEVRIGGSKPWLVYNAGTVAGRIAAGQTFVAHETRWDYPLETCGSYGGVAAAAAAGIPCYDPNNPPVLGSEQSFTFSINDKGAAIAPASGFTWQMSNGQAPVSYADSTVANGFATAVLGYSSPRNRSLIFTSVTGSNEVLQADPAILRADVTGLQGYR